MARAIELRSDTCTLPTEEMREAMRLAEVGDDVFGEDPTVNALEGMAAHKVGKEAAMFVPTGTMGNLAAILTHCRRGDEAIMESDCHIYYYEVGGLSALGGIIPRLITGKDGLMDPEDIRKALRMKNIHYAPTSCIAVENSHNRGGGTVMPVETLQEIREIADENGLSVHMDGARIFNAAIALGVDAATVAAPAHSIMFCLSKGLSAPVGSILAGSKDFIDRARKHRKMLGGGMRQAGVLAAAGIIALETMVLRLKEDHDNAKTLAQGLSEIDGVKVDLATVQTNIVRFNVESAGIGSERFAAELGALGVRATTRPPHDIRMVTSRMFAAADIGPTLEAVRQVVKAHLR